MSVLCSKWPQYVFTSTVVVCTDPFPPAPSTPLAIKTQKNTRGPLITLEQQMKEISKWNIPLISRTAQV